MCAAELAEVNPPLETMIRSGTSFFTLSMSPPGRPSTPAAIASGPAGRSSSSPVMLALTVVSSPAALNVSATRCARADSPPPGWEQDLAALGNAVEVPAGTVLFEEHAPCRGFPFVLAGEVRFLAYIRPRDADILLTPPVRISTPA